MRWSAHRVPVMWERFVGPRSSVLVSLLLASTSIRVFRWRRCVLVALGVLVLTSANALIPVANSFGWFHDGIGSSGPRSGAGFATHVAACKDLILQMNPYRSSPTFYRQSTDTVCAMDRPAGIFFENHPLTSGAACPANSTPVTGGCQCGTGFVENAGQCTPNQCGAKLNKPITVNWTIGWTRTNNDDDRKWIGGTPSVPPTGGNVCMEGCMVGVNLELVGGPYRSQAPAANGMYRTSADFSGVGLGGVCTETTTSVDKQQPIPPCPGYVGEGPDGKAGCYGTADKPVTPTTAPIPPDNKDPIAGNPAAGAKPTEGEGGGTGGSGRTPTEGEGGNAGGPRAAATPAGPGGGAGGSASGTGTATGGGVGGGTGSVGSGTGESGEEQAACGAPGQPICAVKFDEDGVSDAQTKSKADMETEGAKLGDARDKLDGLRDKAGGVADKGFMEPIRSLFWVPSAGGCEGYTLPENSGGLTIDPCNVVSGVQTAMAFLWAIGGFWLCLGMIKRSI